MGDNNKQIWRLILGNQAHKSSICHCDIEKKCRETTPYLVGLGLEKITEPFRQNLEHISDIIYKSRAPGFGNFITSKTSK